MSDTSIKSGTTKKKGGSIIPIAGVCCAIVVVGAVALFGSSDETTDKPKRNVVVTQDNVEEVLEEMENKPAVSFGSYEVNMTFDWVFPDATSASTNAYVENSTANTNDVYFDIIRSDTNETIYESPVLPLGSHLENITLGKDLDAGTYDCVMVYHLVDEDQNTLSTLNMSLTIIVEN